MTFSLSTEPGGPGPGCIQLEGHLHVFKQTSPGCQGPVHRPCCPQPQESAGCSSQVSGRWEAQSWNLGSELGNKYFVRVSGEEKETSRGCPMYTGPRSDGPLLCLFVPPRAVTDSINQLITMCTQQAPGQKECDNALRELEVGPSQASRG